MAYKDLSPKQKLMFKVMMFLFLGFLIYAGVKYSILTAQDNELFESRQAKTQHILIDKIDDYKIWLIVYDGDTVGTVSTK